MPADALVDVTAALCSAHKLLILSAIRFTFGR